MSKFFSFLGWTFLFLTFISFITIYQYQKIDDKIQKVKILEYEQEKEKEKVYFGLIFFPTTGQQRLIKYGNPERIVKKFYIGIFGTLPTNYPQDSLILVGHNRYMQFSSLEKLKIQDEVVIKRRNYHYFYHVKKIITTSVTDLSFLTRIKENQLILITCLDDSSKRLVVFCDFRKSKVTH